MSTYVFRATVAITALLSFAAVSPALHADVKVAGVGAPYATIQAAVNAATDGDVVLVRQGNYLSGFTIDNKAISVVSYGFTVVQGRVEIRNLAVTRTVLLSQITIQTPDSPNTGASSQALLLTSNSGAVRVVGCTIQGANNSAPWLTDYVAGPGDHGISIQDCAGTAAFVRCTMRGGNGTGIYISYCDGREGGDAFRVTNSRTALYDCALDGGSGGVGGSVAGNGGHGARLISTSAMPTFALSSNCAMHGGRPGYFCESGVCYSCPGGPGAIPGDGFWIGSGAAAWQLDTTLTAFPGVYWNGYHSPNGRPLRNQGLNFEFAVSHVRLSTPAVVASGAPLALSVSADPGDAIHLIVARGSPFQAYPSRRGVVLARDRMPAPQPNPSMPIAVLPGSGTTSVSFALPPLAPGQLSAQYYLQAYRVTPGGQVTLGSFAPVTVLDPTL